MVTQALHQLKCRHCRRLHFEAEVPDLLEPEMQAMLNDVMRLMYFNWRCRRCKKWNRERVD